MRIKICGFKCHLDAEFTFTNNEMTLIKGISSAGKSSILQAIYFALYGNMRSIYNNAGITKNLSVTLELPGIHIVRKKNPELLVVTLLDNNSKERVYEPNGSGYSKELAYEDAIAQSIIDNHFGNREVWKACSYIEQKSRCSLLSGSSSERMELLNALSFTGENPKEYISKISNVLKEKNLEFTAKQASFVTEIELYNSSVKDVKRTLSLDESNKLKQHICSLTNLEKSVYQEVCNFERMLGTYNYLENQIKALEIKVASYVEPTEQEAVITVEEVRLNEKQIISFQEYSTLKNKLSQELSKIQRDIENKNKLSQDLSEANNKLAILQEKIINIPNVNELINTVIDSKDIWKASNLEKERERSIKECQELNLDENRISETLTELTERLQRYTYLEKYSNDYKRLIALEKEISNCEEGNLEELETLSREKNLLIADLRKGLELLSCPSCKVPLRYRNGELSVGERNPVSEEEIRSAETELSQINSLILQSRKWLSLKDNMKNLEHISEIREELEQYLSRKESISSLSNLINRISNIKLEGPKLSSKVMTDIAEFQKCYFLKEDLEKKNIVVEDDSKIKEELKELEEKYCMEQERVEKNQELLREHQKKLKEMNRMKENMKKAEVEKMKYQEDIKELNEKKSELGKINLDWNVKEKYEAIKGELESEKKKLEEAEHGNKVVEKGKILTDKREDVVRLQTDVEALTRLKLKAVEVECKQLEDTVNNINTILETTLPIFFNEPITMRLLLYKQMKNKIKPGLNLEICYKGCKYDNVSNLSGGEGDRISLGLLLALNAVSNSPILLLDECVSSLDEDLKESCITAIKSIPGKTVVVVDHDSGLEGFYDSVVKM